MASSLSSLGLGSQGALSFDVIDQLRAVDDSTQVKPLDSKIEINSVKKSDLSLLTTFAASLKASTSSLTSQNTYLSRTTSVTGTAVTASAVAGTTIQDFSVDVQSLAQNDIYQSRSFTNATDTFTSSSDTIQITVDGETYDIEVDASTSITNLKDKIFDKTDGKVSVSILNVGGDDPYKLIVKSTQTGANNTISMTSTNDSLLNLGLANNKYTADTPVGTHTGTDTLTFTIAGTGYDIAVADGDSITEIQNKINLHSTLGPLVTASIEDGKLVFESLDDSITVSAASGSDVTFGLNNTTTTQPNHLQAGADASFTFAGVNITRSTNTVSDLVVGISLTLAEVGVSNVSITQDTSGISTNIESFVTKYNELMSNLNESTKYDSDSKASGTFQGVSQVVSLKSDINRQLLFSDNVPRTEEEIEKLLTAGAANGITRDDIGQTRMRTFAYYGVELNSSGMLEFNQEVFDAKLLENPSDMENFFIGSTITDSTSISGTQISTGAIDILSGDLIINDKNIAVSLNGTASENAIALKTAINNASIDGVEAVINDDGESISIKSNAGYDITISGDAAKLTSIGLKGVSTFGNSTTTDGYFTKFNSILADYVTGSDSIFSLYDSQLQTKSDALDKEKLTTVERLDIKYALMARRFAAYDGIIGQLNSQFASLSLQIEAAFADK